MSVWACVCNQSNWTKILEILELCRWIIFKFKKKGNKKCHTMLWMCFFSLCMQFFPLSDTQKSLFWDAQQFDIVINIKLNWLSFSTIFSHSFVIIVTIIASIYLFIYLLMSLMLWNRLIAPYLCIMQSSIWIR